MNGYTLMQRYYGINAALNAYLVRKDIQCPVIKYGVDPALLKTRSKDQKQSIYPYMMSHISNVKPVSWTSQDSGTLTDFDYQLSFFTSPIDEVANDSNYWTPFEVAKIAFSDINEMVLSPLDVNGNVVSLADLVDLKFHYEFEMKSGSPVPSAFLIARLRAVCGYGITLPVVGLSTDIDNAINMQWGNV